MRDPERVRWLKWFALLLVVTLEQAEAQRLPSVVQRLWERIFRRGC